MTYVERLRPVGGGVGVGVGITATGRPDLVFEGINARSSICYISGPNTTVRKCVWVRGERDGFVLYV